MQQKHRYRYKHLEITFEFMALKTGIVLNIAYTQCEIKQRMQLLAVTQHVASLSPSIHVYSCSSVPNPESLIFLKG